MKVKRVITIFLGIYPSGLVRKGKIWAPFFSDLDKDGRVEN
jgi:hypothetical protein